MNIKHWSAPTLIFLIMSFSDPCIAVTLDELKNHYRSVRVMNAKLALTKKSKYLKRPAVSEVNMDVKDGFVLWETVRPVHAKVVLDKDGITMDGVGMDTATKEKTKPVIDTVRSLVTFDWSAIESAMDISVDRNTLHGTPHPGSALSLFTKIDFVFKDNLEPESMTLTRPGEETKIDFQTFHVGPTKK